MQNFSCFIRKSLLSFFIAKPATYILPTEAYINIHIFSNLLTPEKEDKLKKNKHGKIKLPGGAGRQRQPKDSQPLKRGRAERGVPAKDH